MDGVFRNHIYFVYALISCAVARRGRDERENIRLAFEADGRVFDLSVLWKRGTSFAVLSRRQGQRSHPAFHRPILVRYCHLRILLANGDDPK